MKDTIISWNFVNWVTVFLMVTIGTLIVGVGLKMLAKKSEESG